MFNLVQTRRQEVTVDNEIGEKNYALRQMLSPFLNEAVQTPRFQSETTRRDVYLCARDVVCFRQGATNR